jgi:hypothetical protein
VPLLNPCLLSVLQLADAATTLTQLQNEHAELTRVLIDAKVEIAEKKGEALVKSVYTHSTAAAQRIRGAMVRHVHLAMVETRACHEVCCAS